MRYALLPLLTFFFMTYVNVGIAQVPISSVEIQEIFTDSTLNCRALEVQNGQAYFATSDGRVVQYNISDNKIDTLWIADSVHFRSLAVVGGNVFALGIESPALLFKNGKVVYREDNEKAFYDSMEFWNTKEGIAMGDPTDSCISIIRTHDGGNSWHKISCEQLPASIEGEGAFAASDTNIKLSGDKVWIATGGMVSRIHYSSDNGDHWLVGEVPIIQGKSTTGMYSMDFYDDSLGFAIGGDYTNADNNIQNKIKTEDGGKTWKLIASGTDPGYRSCVQYVPESNGMQLVAIGFKGIDISNDGGEKWTTISTEGFYTIRFINSNEAFAAGNGRVAYIKFN